MDEKFVCCRYFGDTLLGKVIEETDEELILGDVINIVVAPTPQGLQVMSIPFSPTTMRAEKVILRKDFIYFQEDGKELYDNLENARMQQEAKIQQVKKPSDIIIPK